MRRHHCTLIDIFAAPILLSPEKLGAYDLLFQQMVAKKQAIESGIAGTSTTDLIAQLIKGQNDEIVETFQPSRLTRLGDSELMGNLFAFIVAGYGTQQTAFTSPWYIWQCTPCIAKGSERGGDRLGEGI